MKIVKITINNFLKLADVEFDPKKVNVIVGKNGQGKTSILKAIQTAFTGKVDESMIKNGEEKAQIILDLDELQIDRRITEKGNYVTVSNQDGFQRPSPQKFLNGMIGQFSFNPIEWYQMSPKDKKKYLLEAIDIRLSKERLEGILGEPVEMDLNRHALEVVAEVHKTYYQQRTVVNADVSKKQKAVAELKAQIPEGFDPATFNEERVAELRKAVTDNELKKQKKDTLAKELQTLKTEIADMEVRLKQKKEAFDTGVKEYQSMEIQDTAKLEEELKQFDSQRELVHTHKQVVSLEEELMTDLVKQRKLDGIVKTLAKELPAQLIAEADLPIQGLGIDGEFVTLNGINIENLSSSEQVKLALTVVRKLNNDFKIICIDGLEILDKETFEWFVKEIEQDDYQYFVTRVDGEHGYFVQDGVVTEK